VASDIVLPSPSDFSDVSEASLTDPLKWDTVAAARFEPVNRVQPYLAALREKSKTRVATSKDFSFLRDEIALIKKSVADKSISLNEAERRKEMAQAKTRKEAREQEAKALRAGRPTTYEITLKNSAQPGLPAPMAAEKAPAKGKGEKGGDEEGAALGRSPIEEIVLNESVQILADYVAAQGAKPAGKTP